MAELEKLLCTDSKVESLKKINAIIENGGGLDDKITNCLLEVPQNIKLELNDGTLTLKAGSKVIVPNGFEADGVTKKFDEVMIESDLSLTPASLSSNTRVLFINTRNNARKLGVLSYCLSGTTPVQGYYYHTGENKMYIDTVLADGLSFPLMYGEWVKDEGYASIDQIFNGMGYIGSTIWVDKGVKCLIPNGRNEDGSLKNIEFTTNTVAVSDRSVLDGENRAFLFNYTRNALEDKAYSEDNKTIAGSGQYLYNPITNNIYNSVGLSSRWVLCGFYTSVNGQITSLQPKQPFRAVDYNDYRTEVDSKVSKSGGTLTGNLHIKNTTPFVSLINSDFDKTNTETLSANKTLSYLRTRDKNNIDFFSLANTYMANGNVQSTWNVGRTIDGSNKTVSISIGVTPTGTLYTYAPTPSTGDKSTKIATTAFVNSSCDGQWVRKSQRIAELQSLAVTNGDATIEYDLSSYLPSDNYKYEVAVSIDVGTGGKTGAYVSSTFYSTGTSNGSTIFQRAVNVATGSTFALYQGNCINVPIGTDRKLGMMYTVGVAAANLNALHLEGYRRIGTNA